MQKVQKVQTVQKKSAFAHFPALPGRVDLCPGLHWIELSHKLK